ncbi:MAG: bifunctional hydroxymethylpyrimidine kinase/phosphomethylpyrimidine kinase [Candidatus Marinimicrobia bacterium]|nr:bifunctional hydroxymethylpyrimidine kinase/phosphomethylpyrimidine kinase [Candidatus Neomarinimicrobiota bacterium]
MKTFPVVLSIAGSDSGGGAGIQADLKTFSALRVYGATAITCVTAQTPQSVSGIHPLPAEFVHAQIEAVCRAFPVAVAKTGMLHNAGIIRMVAADDIRQGLPVLVVDPVMISASGARLLEADAVEALRECLLPKARVVTPNIHEAEILCGRPIADVEDQRRAAEQIGQAFDVACVVKGGNLQGEEIVDVLYDEGDEHLFTGPRVIVREAHGAGCAFSAAIAAYLAHGKLLSEAVRLAKAFVGQALHEAVPIGHHVPLNFFAGSGTHG